jgi:hypothetical protein
VNRHGKTDVVGASVGNREKRIGRSTVINVDAVAVVGVDIGEAALQQTDRARVVFVREDGADVDRSVMGAFLVEWVRKRVDR